MKLNINEKKALYTFGCPNHRATVEIGRASCRERV